MASPESPEAIEPPPAEALPGRLNLMHPFFRLSSILASFALVLPFGWAWGGWVGLALGFVLAFPLMVVLFYLQLFAALLLMIGFYASFAVIVSVVMGSLWIFNRRQFDIITGKIPEPLPEEPDWFAVPTTTPEPPRRAQFRLRRALAVIAVLGVWLGVAAARAAHTPDDRQGAIALVILLPFLIIPLLYAIRWFIRVTDEMQANTYRPRQ